MKDNDIMKLHHGILALGEECDTLLKSVNSLKACFFRFIHPGSSSAPTCTHV